MKLYIRPQVQEERPIRERALPNVCPGFAVVRKSKRRANFTYEGIMPQLKTQVHKGQEPFHEICLY